MATTTIYGPDGQGYLADKATGRRLHPLETDAPRLAETVAGLRAEIAKIQANDNYSQKYKDEATAQRQAQIEQYLDGSQGDYYKRALSEFETLQVQRDAQRSLNTDAFRQKVAPMLTAVTKELEGKAFANLGELDAFYIKALKDDPTMAYAIELSGESLARRIDPRNPQNGSWVNRLERAKLSRGESDATRALLAKMEILEAGVGALNTVSRGFHRQANGVSTPHLGTHTRAIQELQWSIAHYIGEHAALVQPGDDDGRAGGVYLPSAMPIFTEG